MHLVLPLLAPRAACTGPLSFCVAHFAAVPHRGDRRARRFRFLELFSSFQHECCADRERSDRLPICAKVTAIQGFREPAVQAAKWVYLEGLAEIRATRGAVETLWKLLNAKKWACESVLDSRLRLTDILLLTY